LNVSFQFDTNHVVNKMRRGGVLRIGIVLLTGLAWFGIANHCVLTAMETPAAKATVARCHEDCCGDQSPGKSKSESGSECCKTLHATLVVAKKLVGYDTSLFALQFYFVAPELLLNDPKGTVRGTEFDTGPPFAKTFFELTLQRSILAHAPPSLG
jgi:hypothetical protein